MDLFGFFVAFDVVRPTRGFWEVQTALMSCTSVDIKTMFQVPEPRGRDEFCIRRDRCGETCTPLLILTHPDTSSRHDK